MKKQILYLASAALVAGLAACSNDELGEASSINLKNGQLAATIQDAVATRTSIDGQYKLSWIKDDAIGVYGSLKDNNTDNFEYDITTTGESEAEAVTGLFTAAKNQEIPDDFAPAVAYYPYGKDHNEKITSQGRLALYLDPAPKWKKDEVKAPMVGDVVNGNISFKAVTALLKISVEDLPYAEDNTLTHVILETTGKNAIAGKAYVDLTKSNDERVLEISGDSKSTAIDMTFTNSVKADYDFYFIIPEGDYDELTVTLSDESNSSSTYAKTLISTKSLEAKANHIYTKTLRFDGDDLEDGVIAQLNDDLVTVTNNGTVSADLSKATATSGTIILPSVASDSEESPLDQITINLQNLGASQALTLQPSITGGLTPKKVIVKVSNAPAVKGTSSQKLTIALPNSSVEIAPIEDEVTLDAVEFSTQPNVLKLDKGVTVTALTKTATSGTGNVYVADGATLSAITVNSLDTYVFYETAKDVEKVTEGTNTFKAEKAIYELLYPVVNGTPALSEDYTLKAPIEIAVDNVVLDLNGNVLTAPASGTAITVKNGGKLTIVDNKKYAANQAATAKITGAASKVATIVVENGGTLIVEGGEIVNSNETATSAYAIDASGAVTISDGKVTSVLNVKDQSNVSVEAGTVSGAVNVKGSTKTATFSVSGTGAVSAAIAAGTNSVVNVNGGTVSAGITSSAATSVVNINGGTISTSASANTVTITEGTVTVKGGTISNSTNEKAAIDITKGTLTVTGTGKPSISGYYAISSTPANDDDATITLEADAAQYKGTKYVVFNSESSTAKTVKLTITAGWFDGDFKLDETKYFIKGGHYTNCNQTLKTDQAIQYIGAGYELSASTDDDGYYTASKIK